MQSRERSSFRVIMWWAVALTVVVVAAVAVLGSGYRAYVVRTGSMEPTFSPGDVVIDKPSTGLPVAGEVVTFKSSGPDSVISHRVQEVDGTDVHTKGDANRTPDIAPVGVSSIVGRVVSVIPHGGYVIVYLRQPAGIASVVVLLAMMMLAWGLFFDDEQSTEPSRVT